MVTGETTITLDDVKTLTEIDKAALKEYVRNVFADDTVSKVKSGSKSVLLATEDKLSYKLVAQQHHAAPARTVEESVKGLGLSEAANKKLVKGVQSRDYKRYHLSDVKYIADLISDLEPGQQKKAIDVVIENRKNLYQVNKEDVVLFLLAGGSAGQYHLDLWYSGIMRSLQKLSGKVEVNSEAPTALDPTQQKELKRKMRNLLKKASAVLEKL